MMLILETSGTIISSSSGVRGMFKCSHILVKGSELRLQVSITSVTCEDAPA